MSGWPSFVLLSTFLSTRDPQQGNELCEVEAWAFMDACVACLANWRTASQHAMTACSSLNGDLGAVNMATAAQVLRCAERGGDDTGRLDYFHIMASFWHCQAAFLEQLCKYYGDLRSDTGLQALNTFWQILGMRHAVHSNVTTLCIPFQLTAHMSF